MTKLNLFPGHIALVQTCDCTNTKRSHLEGGSLIMLGLDMRELLIFVRCCCKLSLFNGRNNSFLMRTLS